MPTYCKKISQIQIGGLQPCDDLTWNDPTAGKTWFQGRLPLMGRNVAY